MASVGKLRERVNAALRREDYTKALGYYDALREVEPEEPRWPHRKGDLLRRLGWESQAVMAYTEAIDLYAKLGFVARAAALAKIVLQIDPSAEDILERVDPEQARQLHRKARGERKSASQPRPLESVEDVDDDEIRFAEIDETDMIEIELSELELDTSRKESPAMRLELDELTIEPTTEPPEPPPPPPLSVPPGPPDDDELSDHGEPSASELSVTDLEFIEEEDEPELVFLDHGEEPDRPSAESLAALPAVPLFAELPSEIFHRLLLDSELVEVPRGGFLLQVGDRADTMHVIVEGSVQVLVPGIEEPVVLGEGEVVGETSLLDEVQRRADVVARTLVRTLAIPKTTLDQLTEEHPPLDELLQRLLGRRLLSNLLTTHPIFRGFDPELRREVGKLFELRRAAPGTELMAAGKRPDGLYGLLIGQVEAHDESVTEFLPPGSIVGQHALLGNRAADHTVVCRSECLLLRLSKSRFTELAALYPHVLMMLSELTDLGRPSRPGL